MPRRTFLTDDLPEESLAVRRRSSQHGFFCVTHVELASRLKARMSDGGLAGAEFDGDGPSASSVWLVASLATPMSYIIAADPQNQEKRRRMA
jgi:hypothetical protein